jgi:hypothetical protein
MKMKREKARKGVDKAERTKEPTREERALNAETAAEETTLQTKTIPALRFQLVLDKV